MIKPFDARWRKGKTDTVTGVLFNAPSMAVARTICERLTEESPRLKGFVLEEVRQLLHPIAEEAVNQWNTFECPPFPKPRKSRHASEEGT